ncbi:hypothetical protein L6452_10079 [Arctium lappa]|uniref:Uncharacterized protein n=1 Tax=Arctium lappa TaxID=4217 RepID=A0ACB9DM01_ARCLA|nr:hypothetical protein L6452_10079 [Arctium lappa]
MLQFQVGKTVRGDRRRPKQRSGGRRQSSRLATTGVVVHKTTRTLHIHTLSLSLSLSLSLCLCGKNIKMKINSYAAATLLYHVNTTTT